MIFDHLDLFRISEFEFRICNLIYTWRPSRLCGSPRGISFSQKHYLFIHSIIPQGESFLRHLQFNFSLVSLTTFRPNVIRQARNG
jgi:hypothetical protein